MSMDPEKSYKDWHWGIPHTEEIETDESVYPDELVAAGNLVQLNFRQVNHNPKRKDKCIELNPKERENSWLAFDPNHHSQRLYILLKPSLQKQMKEVFWKDSDYNIQSPKKIAKLLGGKHSNEKYPIDEVKPIGILTACIYACEKKGDGFSWYIHHMGEETGIRPCLCVDKKGRLWIIGGDYTSPIQGITN